uniref:Beta-1,4-N-acetylgalactosaminyltransferase n=1 Tax=Cynoglossus semilaevis TaxID=244447 RepID=A0A3P8UWK6_CYNSE
ARSSTVRIFRKSSVLCLLLLSIFYVFFFPPLLLLLQYLGRANLHVFEDWCGGSTARLRENQHYPLYPHSRTTLQKLAVSPQWTNYGLRIFGYLHPYTDGEFVFAISSKDNSELWLSTDDSPLHVQLLARVGKTGTEWTAPGEFEKYASQISSPFRLFAERRYFFEVIHKQNHKGTDHVEVLLDQNYGFVIIDSQHISLYVNESSFSMNDVAHIPQTLASHATSAKKDLSATVDMLREDLQDTFYQGESDSNFPLLRYQGLQFVRLSYVYPNDYTRLTHMETENSCFYPESQYYMNIRKLFSLTLQEGGNRTFSSSDTELRVHKLREKKAKYNLFRPEKPQTPQSEQTRATVAEQLTAKQKRLPAEKKKKTITAQQKKDPMPGVSEQIKAKEETAVISELIAKKHAIQRRYKKNYTPVNAPNGFLFSVTGAPLTERPTMAKEKGFAAKTDMNVAQWQGLQNSIKTEMVAEDEKQSKGNATGEDRAKDEWDPVWIPDVDFEGPDDGDLTPPPEYDAEVNWDQTFQIANLDFQAFRSDWIDLHCNVSGNLLLRSSEALPLVRAFMEQLNRKHNGRFTLVRVINVVKRADGVQGNRYLLELMLKDVNGQLLRLSHYIYALFRQSRSRNRGHGFRKTKTETLLCNPVGLHWNPDTTVHFIVPVKNQARWVQTLIRDMETLFRITGDTNFNLIITDYGSTDMDVRKALQESSLPRFQYLKLSGDFERSAGLQAGVNHIKDDHSIVFLCDLHIHFPESIIDTIRKHCVEGYKAFAPIVMRLDCGATPQDAKGYWEVNGFGLLGIFKSDLNAVGGMNTKEFKNRWGGEDWELLDRSVLFFFKSCLIA